MTDNCGKTALGHRGLLWGAFALCATMVLPSFAAQNCISNGDFELPVANYNHGTGYSYTSESGNGGKPTGWTLSPNNRMGRVLEGTDRFGVLELMGSYSLFFERRKKETSVLEAKQSFAIPAPGKYRLTLNSCNWAPTSLDYGHLNVFAQVIEPGGSVTNALKSFKPKSFAGGLEGICSFAADTPALAAYGAGNDYTLRLYATESTSNGYAYNVIDKVDFSLRTLVLGENETFTTAFGLEPYDMELGVDSTLTCAPTTTTAEIVPGKVTFATGAKIVFDMASATAGAYVLRTGGLVLPEGASNPLDFIQLANAGDYALSLIEDGRTILVSKSDAVTSATWTGGGDPSVLLDAANWSAVPDASTFNITLGAAADWRGLGALAVSPAATIDLNGNALKLSGLTSAEFTGAAIANSASGAAADLTIDVPAGATNENKSVAILGNICLVKEGAGGFKASKIGQTYWGGTEVNGGTLLAGTHGKFRPFGAPEKNLIANADFEANGLPETWSYKYTSAIPGTEIVGWTPSATSYTGLVNAYFYWTQYATVANDPQYEWYRYALFFSNNRAAQQTFHVDEPGTYRFVFEYGPWVDTAMYDRPPTTVTISGGGVTNLAAVVTPAAEVGYRQFFADVEIASAGDYTLRFDAIGITGNRYIAFDNVSFAPKCEIAVGDGASLDMNGREGYGMYSITVAGGGTLKNDGGALNEERTGFADVTLTGDAAISIQWNYALSGYADATATLDLGGKTLTVTKTTGRHLILRDAEVRNGTIILPGTGWLRSAGRGVDASTVDFVVSSAMQIDAPLTVRNYTTQYDANYNEGTAALNVLGTFTPETAYFYGCTMQDGSTIDLSAKSGAWATTSSFSNGKKTVDYAPNATVNIEVGARELAIGDKVVSWTAKPPVEDNVLFALVRNGTVSETHALAVQDDGLYVKRAAEPAYATYDVANDAWKFYTATDAEVADWEDGVTGNIQVRFASYAEYAALAATNLTPSAYVLTGNLALPAGAGDVDLTAFPFDFPADTTIDLNGRTAKLPEAMMGGTKPFTVTSSVAGGVLVADVAGTVNNTAMTITGNVKLLKTGAGTFTASKTGQTYTGGTEVTNGVLKCATAGTSNPFGPMQNPTELIVNGNFDADTSANWNGATNWLASPVNWCGRQKAGSYMSSKLPVGKFAMIGGSQVKAGTPAQFWQDVAITTPGRYRYSFDHARRKTDYTLEVDVLLVHDGVEQMLTVVTPMSVDSFTRTTGYVEIAEAGTYTLKFRYHRTPANSTEAYYMIFDNVSLVRLSDVKVSGAAAVLDMDARPDYYDYNMILDGATIRNTRADIGNTTAMLAALRLEKDSTLQLDRSYGLIGTGYRRGNVYLGGNTLTANIASGKNFLICNMTFDEGRVEIPVTTGTLITGYSGSGAANGVVAATNVDFSVGCALNLTAPMDVGGYEALYEGTSNAGTVALNVFGTFRPVTSNYYGCVLQDGATLDLSGWQGTWPWSTTSAFTSGNKTVTFADDATIKVKRGAKGGKVVSWETKPSNFDTLTFVRDPSDERRYSVIKKDDGVYSVNGLTVIVR